jgi:hypothetical protein
MTQLLGETLGTMTRTLGAFPPPHLTDRLLFESPIVVPVAVLALALIIGFGMGRAGKGRQGWIVVAIAAAIGVGIAISSRVVETDREAIERLTREFVDSVMENDRGRVGELLSARLTVAADGQSAPLDAREFILSQVERVSAEIERYAANVQEAAVTVEDAAGKSKFAFSVLQSRGYGFGVSTWVLDWQKSPSGGWQIDTIDLVALNGNPPPTGIFSRAR